MKSIMSFLCLLTISLSSHAGIFQDALLDLEKAQPSGTFVNVMNEMYGESPFSKFELEPLNVSKEELRTLACSIRGAIVHGKRFERSFSKVEQLKMQLFVEENCK